MEKAEKITLLLIVSLGVIFSFLAITRHNHFNSQGWDLAIYDQAIWLYSRFKLPFSTLTGKIDFADRFRPILVLLAPFYWFWPNVRFLLIFQAFILTASSYPLFLLSQRVLKNSLFSLSIITAYLLFPGIQSIAVDDFHEIALLPLFLSLFFLFLELKKWRLYFLSLIFSLLVREYVGFLMAFLGVYVFFVKRKPKIGLVTFLLGLSWSLITIWLVMPLFGSFSYYSFLEEGDTLNQALSKFFSNPILILKGLIDSPIKLRTIFYSFFAFSFLPLLHPLILLPILYQFLSRFLDYVHQYRWSILFHYSGELAVLMAVGSIYGARKIKSSLCLPGLVISILLVQILMPTPIKVLLNKDFYQEAGWVEDNHEALRKIPPRVSVAAQNNLVPHLSHREKIFILPKIGEAEYIVVDLHKGQDKWNFYSLTLEKTRELIKGLVESGKYKKYYQKGEIIILKRS